MPRFWAGGKLIEVDDDAETQPTRLACASTLGRRTRVDRLSSPTLPGDMDRIVDVRVF
jgi:hypothetical protein